jgi:hypothetical protein
MIANIIIVILIANIIIVKSYHFNSKMIANIIIVKRTKQRYI